jgi:hypothetical protein
MNVARVFESSLKEEMQLDTVDVTRSPICPVPSAKWLELGVAHFPGT